MSDTQQAIIGYLLLNTNYQTKYTFILDVDFFTDQAKIVIQTIKKLNQENTIAGVVNINEEDKYFALQTMSKTSLADSFVSLLPLLKKEYLARELSNLANLKDLTQLKAKISEIENKAKILDLTKPFTLSEVISQALTYSIDNPFDLENIPKTGFKDFDTDRIDPKNAFGGFMPGHLVTVGAYSGGGKSTFLISLIKNLAFTHETLMFSLEMDNFTLSARILASISGVGTKLCMNLGNDKVQLLIDHFNLREKLNLGLENVEKIKLKMVDDQFDLAKIKATIRETAQNSNLKFVFIDYLQLVKPETSNKMRHLEVSEITRELKLLAKELKITIIQLAQLSRSTLTKSEPQLNDLRESGSIEADSDTVLLIYTDKDNNRWIKIAKDRTFGKFHKCKLTYNAETQSYV
jgi:replicative DNA helicase